MSQQTTLHNILETVSVICFTLRGTKAISRTLCGVVRCDSGKSSNKHNSQE